MITIEEHEKYGLDLQKAHNFLGELQAILSNEYGAKNKSTVLAIDAFTAVTKLKSRLDDRVCAEFQDIPDDRATNVYYCNSKLR